MTQLDAVKRSAADRLEVPPVQAARARAVVARHATSPEDARLLLAMLGIDRDEDPAGSG